MASTGVKVAVRCRPLNSREIARGAKPLIRMSGNQTMLDAPDVNGQDSGNAKVHSAKSHSFAFDHSYWSAGDKDDNDYASQQTLFNDLGVELLDNAFQGFNACIFAYVGRKPRRLTRKAEVHFNSGSGKSYSMMGYGADRGIIPLTCSALFDRITEQTSDTLSFTVEVSFIEIYNEKVNDLLNPKNKGNLKVREHPSLGPYVEDLSKLGVETFADMERLMDEGNKARTVAATQMNETSSRSHSVFTVLLTQKRLDLDTKMVGEKVSRISLVDLAGSERANSTGATGQRLKEGANINKSLTTLGKVIAALASQSSKPETPKGGAKKKASAAEFIPYRDSVLTWLLKDSLGGNSKTAMIAAISPADYEETLSTLRYADQAKKIQNKAVVNEDANAKLVRELKEELATLRARVSGASLEATYDPTVPPEKQIVQYQTKSGEIRTVTKAALQEQLEQSEKLMEAANQTWEEKMEKTVVIQKEREKALEELGIVIEKGNVGVHTPKKMPHLVNLNEDPLMSECLIYQIKPGRTAVGNVENADTLDIRLSGANVLPLHCVFESSPDGNVDLHAEPGSMTMVNGMRIGSDKPKRLKSGYRIILGDVHVFRFNHPEEVRRSRDGKAIGASGLQNELRSPVLNSLEDEASASRASSPALRPASPTTSNVDWNYARREAVVARLNGTDVDLDKLEDQDLNKLFQDLMKVRSNRRHGTSMGRPESRASFLESIDEDNFDEETDSGSASASRPFSGDTWATDDTSLDSTMTFSGPASSADMEIRLEEAKEELQRELDAQREEYETKLRTLANSATTVENSIAEKARAEEQLQVMQEQMQVQLDEQKKQYEKKMKRMARRAQKSNGGGYTPETYDERETYLVKKALTKWRSLRRVGMAQVALSSAVLLKEANVFSREFDKKVTYQFTVVDEAAAPISALEGISALAELEDVSDPILSSASKPFIAVKVLDKRNNSIYIWSVERLAQRVQQMHRIFSLLDKPSYSQHFSLEDPFYHTSPPTYSFVGTAVFPLAPLARKLLLLTSARIFSRYTGEQIASCAIRVKPLGISSSATDSASTLSADLTEGTQYSFEVNIDSVAGLDGADFSGIHCQLRLSSLVGISTKAEDVMASPIAEVDTVGSSRLRLRKTFTINITPEILLHLRTQNACIEFFGSCKPAYLTKSEKWDETKEEKAPLRPWQLSRAESDLETNTTGRRAETELLTDQLYDCKAMVSVQELSGSGQYLPVQLVSGSALDPGVFHCHQGLQRRIQITLSHGSGRQWLWKSMKNVKIGNIRLLDPKGHILESKGSNEVPLSSVTLKPPEIDYQSNGTTSLSFTTGWDSSAQNSLFLNRTTAANNRVLLEISWELKVDSVAEPIHFTVDIGLAIQGRDARSPSKLFNLFSSQKTATQASHMFQIRLSPALTNKPGELWRLNTASTFVRGEELLQAWKPRGISLIDEYYRLVHTERAMANVATTQAVLAAIPHTRLLPFAVGHDEHGRLWDTLQLWQKQFGTRDVIKLVQDPTWEDIKTATSLPMTGVTSPRSGSSSSNGVSSRSSRQSGKDAKSRRLKASIKHIPRAETTAKKGYLYLMNDSNTTEEGGDSSASSPGEWQRVYAVLRRPYLSLYRSSSEAEELENVINVSTVRVDHSTALEEVLSRRFAFGIYTPVSALFAAAQTYPEMLAWVNLIDPTWQRQA